MDFNTGLQQMIDNIFLYEKGNINLCRLKENLFGLYELIDGRLNSEFADRFHEYWDYLEEVVAVEGEAEYKAKTDAQIIPELRLFLLDRLKGEA